MSAAMLEPISLDLSLPWSPDEQQEAFFYKSIKYTLIALFILFLIVPWLPVFESDYIAPEREIVKTKVILQETIKPIVKPVEKKPVVEVKKKPLPSQSKEKKPNNASAKKSPSEPTKKKSSSNASGLAQMSKQLSALKGVVNVAGIKQKTATHAKGTVATANLDILGENRLTVASDGLDIDIQNLKSTSSELVSHEMTTIDGPELEGGDGSSRSQVYSSYKNGQRDMDSVRQTFEEKKGSIYALFNRALNDNPELNGKFIFKLVIEPEGHISDIKLIVSELNHKQLEETLLSQIKKIHFGHADAAVTQLEYKFVFFPS